MQTLSKKFPRATLIILAIAAATLATATLACGFITGNPGPEEPLPTLNLTPITPPTPEPTQTPDHTPMPTQLPTAQPTQPPSQQTPPPQTKESPAQQQEQQPQLTPPDLTKNSISKQRNICKRTPEVQIAIITALDQVGPELPCNAVNPTEMYRLRNLEVNAPNLQKNDLTDLPNIYSLTLTTRVTRLRDMTPGTFSGMEHLDQLTLNLSHPRSDPRPTHSEQLMNSLFKNVNTISNLTININENSPSFLVTKEPFRDLSNLSHLSINHIHAIDPNAFELMKNLRSITLTGQHALETSRQQTLPPDIFKNQLHLQAASIQGLQFPDAMTLASFEAACHAQQWMPKTENDDPTIQIFVDRQKVDLIKPGPEDKKEGCLLRVGDNRLIEVLR